MTGLGNFHFDVHVFLVKSVHVRDVWVDIPGFLLVRGMILFENPPSKLMPPMGHASPLKNETSRTEKQTCH